MVEMISESAMLAMYKLTEVCMERVVRTTWMTMLLPAIETIAEVVKPIVKPMSHARLSFLYSVSEVK